MAEGNPSGDCSVESASRCAKQKLVEELSQHLRDRYDEMLAGGTSAEQAYQSLLSELNDGTLVSGLKATLTRRIPHCQLERMRASPYLRESGTTCALVRGCCGKILDSRW